MENQTLSFPEMPYGADKSIIRPSSLFKKQVYRSAAAIALFVLTYLFLLFAAIAIAVVFGLLGYRIFSAKLGLITIVLAIGFIVSGLMLVFFVIKFLFKRTRADYSGMMEIHETEQPGLFSFIKKLTTETASPMPKRIFITAEVNAAVFYNSSFWSMFFPVRKNLQIGLGLVNSLNISEFKAIMAHEFGHFSQRSMKFGSYVFNLNKVIHNMLYENKGYETVLDRWARMHNLFRLMAYLNLAIISGMKSILKKVYVIVNKTHLCLSREMEFHADSISAFASGSNQGISALRRIEIGQLCYDRLLNYWGTELKENRRSGNLYPQHSEVIQNYARKHNLAVDKYGLPETGPKMAIVPMGLIELDDPWSSHPLTEDRVLHLESLKLNTETVTGSAWLIFDNPKKLQERITATLYPENHTNNTVVVEDIEEFKIDFFSADDNLSYNPAYKNYFDSRDIIQFDIDETIKLSGKTESTAFDSVFSDENCKLPALATELQLNISMLEQLIEIRTDVKYFYYRATKTSRDDATELKARLMKSLEDVGNQIKNMDRTSFIHFYNIDKSDETRAQLVNKYRLLFKYQTEAQKDYDLYNDILRTMRPVYSRMKPTEINKTVNSVYAKEKIVKPRIKEITTDDELTNYISAADLNALKIYLKTNWIYYLNPSYDKTALDVFNNAMKAYISTIYNRTFEIKKDLLNFQINIQNKN